MTMLQQARPRTRLDLEGDSDAMFFYATNHAGEILRGERFGTGDNVFALVELGDLLIHYSYVAPGERPSIARQIEAKASALLRRVR
jgi:hypothetical protein